MDCRVTPGMTKIDIHSRGAITPESCRTTCPETMLIPKVGKVRFNNFFELVGQGDLSPMNQSRVRLLAHAMHEKDADFA